MQSNVLGTEEIAAGLDATGNFDGERALACMDKDVVSVSGQVCVAVLYRDESCTLTIARPCEL